MLVKNSSGPARTDATNKRARNADRKNRPNRADSKSSTKKKPYRRQIELHSQGRSPAELFHLSRLLEQGANPLICMVSGGRLDVSGLLIPDETPPLGYTAAVIFSGVLTSDQIIIVPNQTRWWWIQNATTGAFTLTIRTPSGTPSGAIPQNSAWQLVQCDSNNNIVLSPQHIRPKTTGAREWIGSDQQQSLTEIFHLACVPKDRISDELAFAVSQAVERALLDQRVRNLKRRKEMRVPFRRISHLRRQLLKALDELDDEAFQASSIERVSVVGLLTALLDVPLRYLATSQPKNRVSNRPRGSRKNPILRMLILDLYPSINEAKGRLTLYGGGGESRGTLPAVLEILRPYLPEVIPAKLPYETLRDIRKSARQAQHQRSR